MSYSEWKHIMLRKSFLNNKMNVLIIEDEKIAANNLEKMLRQIDSNIYIQSEIDTIEEAVKWLNNNKTDLIFLDIHLADGLCFKIFEQTKVEELEKLKS